MPIICELPSRTTTEKRKQLDEKKLIQRPHTSRRRLGRFGTIQTQLNQEPRVRASWIGMESRT